jgi:hypothetical protein
MEHYAGIDVSLERSSLCILDATGRIVREAKIASEPEALIGWLADLDLPLASIGLEAGPLSQWLHAALVRAGYQTAGISSGATTMASRVLATIAFNSACSGWGTPNLSSVCWRSSSKHSHSPGVIMR